MEVDSVCGAGHIQSSNEHVVTGSSLESRIFCPLQKEIAERNRVVDEFTTSERDDRDEVFETRQALVYTSLSHQDGLLFRS